MTASDAVFVRVLWGADVLRVEHLAPPRSFHVGEALLDGGVALPAAQLGAAALPIVLVEGGRVSAIVPPAASVTIERDPAAGAAPDQEVEVTPWDGAPGARRVALSRGVRVTMILPAPATGSVYRAAPGALGGSAPIVLEVGLGRAAPPARRRPLAGLGRLVAAVALVAAAATGVLGLAHATEPPPPDDDEVSDERRFAMIEGLVAVADREDAAEEERNAGSPRYRDDGVEKGTVPFEHRDLGFHSLILWPPPVPDELDEMPLEALLRGPPPCLTECWGPVLIPSRRWVGVDFSTAHEALRWGWYAPGWLGGADTPTFREDSLSNRPSRLWFEQVAAARRALPAPPGGAAPPVRLERRSNSWAARGDAEVDRQVRGRLRDVRACHALGRALEPALTGWIDLSFRVDAHGEATNPVSNQATVPDPHVVQCALRALDGLRMTPPAGRGLHAYRLWLGGGG